MYMWSYSLDDIWFHLHLQNDQCVTQSDTTMRGTCMTQDSCTSRGGTADGNCASGKPKNRSKFGLNILKSCFFCCRIWCLLHVHPIHLWWNGYPELHIFAGEKADIIHGSYEHFYQQAFIKQIYTFFRTRVSPPLLPLWRTVSSHSAGFVKVMGDLTKALSGNF